MNFDEVINKRVSCRIFNDKDVEQKNINAIIDCARMAPSAKNRQPWLYVQVSKEQKNLIAKKMYEYIDKNKNEQTGLASAKIVENANKLILVYRTSNKEEDYSVDMLSIGASIENACLKATELGISSLWLRDICCVQSYIKQFTKIEFENVAGLCLGYSNQQKNIKKKKTLKEIYIINE